MTGALGMPKLTTGDQTADADCSAPLTTWAAFSAIAFVGSMSFGVALVSLAKLALFLSAATVLTWSLWGAERAWQPPLTGLAVHALVCLMLFALSLFWADISLRQSLSGWVKYSKLLIPVLLCIMLRRMKWIKVAFVLLICFQWLVLLLTWIIIVDGRPGWLPSTTSSLLRPHETSPFTTYLDQSIMNVLSAAMAWHCKRHFESPGIRKMLLGFVFFSVVTSLYTIGRTGQLMIITIASVIFLFTIFDAEKQTRKTIIARGLPIGLILTGSLFLFNGRFDLATEQFRLFQQAEEIETSIGERLHYWQVGLEMLRDRPIIGYGVGSWTDAYTTHTEDALKHPRGHEVSNPHQEFIHWAVQLGLIGIVLLIAWFYMIWKTTLEFHQGDRRNIICLLAGIAVAFFFNSSLYDALIGDFIVGTVGLALAFGLQARREFHGPDKFENPV